MGRLVVQDLVAMEYSGIVLKFIIGGSIIAGVTFLASEIDPRYGGILAAAPLTTTLAFIITRAETSLPVTRDLVFSSFYFALPSVLFLVCLYLLLSRLDLAGGIAVAGSVWLGAVLIMNRLPGFS